MEISNNNPPLVTEEMRTLAGLAWDWYRLDGNETGGALHITLDDYNVEDVDLDYCATLDTRYSGRWTEGEWVDEMEPYPPGAIALRDRIIAGLRSMTLQERVVVVHVADPYGSVRP